MKDFIGTIDNFLTKDDCNNIINDLNQLKSIDGALMTEDISDGRVDNNIRSSKIRWVNDLNIKNMLYEAGNELNRMIFGFDIFGGLRSFDVQYTEYDSANKGQYNSHLDTVVGMNLDNPFSDRKLSLVLQLTDENSYEGGDLLFDIHNNIDNKPNFRSQGTLIAFPSWLSHRVTPVIAGKRNSLVAWLEGPHWK